MNRCQERERSGEVGVGGRRRESSGGGGGGGEERRNRLEREGGGQRGRKNDRRERVVVVVRETSSRLGVRGVRREVPLTTERQRERRREGDCRPNRWISLPTVPSKAGR